jgi:catechol 2,3-dioxygenase-like lactoylglutathione lyase family enzyme
MTEGGFPEPNAPLTHILVVSDIEASRRFYSDVLGAKLFREYGGTSAVYEFLGAWLLLVTSGGPTRDKPSITMAPPADPDQVSAAFTIRVNDCRAVYDALAARGAEFITPPYASEGGHEIRCFFRDPDGHLFEISEYNA